MIMKKLCALLQIFCFVGVFSVALASPFDVNTTVVATSSSNPGAIEAVGTVTQWIKGKEVPLSLATVLIGTNLSLKAQGSTDVVSNAKGIVAEVTTNKAGVFSAKIPAGTYSVILWKKGYVPATYSMKVPGTFKGTISVDNQVGATGRHVNLLKK
ncbi:hypothetical protein H4684_003352 [Desulfomicrobium macestii]|uniref:Carboxypeptidase regulatory-like domain-containing protein n=1 Tax=Desulfomicrobium macestii TaxID=90731 RepID=A0ABR9H7J2_9BACT|nr:carboxypeptidase-like regulatory domain-containing protein [Desulfomicrobium macestii]MBE1426686.1 hypothetical protein [Desulfomicrobium macestii]